MNKSQKTFNEMMDTLAKITGNEQLAQDFVQMHMQFIRTTREYVDKQVGFARSANARSNDNQREINRYLLNESKYINQLRDLQIVSNNLIKRLEYLETPIYKRIWNKIWYTNKK